MHLPFGKPVHASDGTTLGHLDTLVVHADDHRVTHFVIRSGFVLPLDVVAPIETVTEYSDNAVHLNLTAEDAKALPPFVPARFHLPMEAWIPPTPYLSGVGDFLLWTQNAGGEYQTLPVVEGAGENFTITAGTPVYCGDTMVGTVDDVLTEADTGLVTHFAVRRGVFLHHDALVSLAQVESVDDSGIKLALTVDDTRHLPDYTPR